MLLVAATGRTGSSLADEAVSSSAALSLLSLGAEAAPRSWRRESPMLSESSAGLCFRQGGEAVLLLVLISPVENGRGLC